MIDLVLSGVLKAITVILLLAFSQINRSPMSGAEFDPSLAQLGISGLGNSFYYLVLVQLRVGLMLVPILHSKTCLMQIVLKIMEF